MRMHHDPQPPRPPAAGGEVVTCERVHGDAVRDEGAHGRLGLGPNLLHKTNQPAHTAIPPDAGNRVTPGLEAHFLSGETRLHRPSEAFHEAAASNTHIIIHPL